METLDDYIHKLASQTYEFIENYKEDKKYIFMHNTLALTYQYLAKFKKSDFINFNPERISVDILIREDLTDDGPIYIDKNGVVKVGITQVFKIGFTKFLENLASEVLRHSRDEISEKELVISIKNYAEYFFDDTLNKNPIKMIKNIIEKYSTTLLIY